MAPFTAVAVSGGVDSLVAAYLLKKQGHKVFGIHFIHGHEKPPAAIAPGGNSVSGVTPPLAESISEIGRQVGIPVEILDCKVPFKEKVVDYFIETYRQGLTPNPCMVCNPLIKFGVMLEFARRLGATRLATGHYARIVRDREGRFHLLRGNDRKKEQSYFLAFLNQQRLAAACFPLGEMTKTEVIRFAAANDLRPVAQDESQDVCFIRGKTYGEFLADQKDFNMKPGLIEDSAGHIIGEHGGLHLFTVGQRRGINCPAAEPYYVIRLDTARNRLVVGFKKDLQTAACTVADINWICDPPDEPIQVLTRVRYRSQAVPSTLFPTGQRKATIRFQSPQSAVTPGQAAVFYREAEVLGGGWIEPANHAS